MRRSKLWVPTCAVDVAGAVAPVRVRSAAVGAPVGVVVGGGALDILPVAAVGLG